MAQANQVTSPRINPRGFDHPLFYLIIPNLETPHQDDLWILHSIPAEMPGDFAGPLPCLDRTRGIFPLP